VCLHVAKSVCVIVCVVLENMCSYVARECCVCVCASVCASVCVCVCQCTSVHHVRMHFNLARHVLFVSEGLGAGQLDCPDEMSD